MGVILFLIIGAIAGWLAGKIMKGRGAGLWANMAIGVIGAFIGGFIFDLINVHTYGLIGSLVTALVGAIVLLWIVGLIKKN